MYITLPSGQRSYPPEMKYDIARNGKRLGLLRQDVKEPFDTAEIAQRWLDARVAPEHQADHTVVEVEPWVEPMSWVDLRTSVKPGAIVENCSCQAVTVVSVDYETGSMECVSLHNGLNSNCDLYHCGIVVLTPSEIERKKAIYAAAGSDDEGRKALADDWRRRAGLDE